MEQNLRKGRMLENGRIADIKKQKQDTENYEVFPIGTTRNYISTARNWTNRDISLLIAIISWIRKDHVILFIPVVFTLLVRLVLLCQAADRRARKYLTNEPNFFAIKYISIQCVPRNLATWRIFVVSRNTRECLE